MLSGFWSLSWSFSSMFGKSKCSFLPLANYWFALMASVAALKPSICFSGGSSSYVGIIVLNWGLLNSFSILCNFLIYCLFFPFMAITYYDLLLIRAVFTVCTLTLSKIISWNWASLQNKDSWFCWVKIMNI